MFARFLLAAVVAVYCFGAAPAWALKLIPFVAEFGPKGQGANKTFRLENDTDEPSAVQLTMVKRDMTLDGQDQLKDAEDEFVVFPPQVVLLPGEGRTVRVQWVGDPQPAAELAYRIIAEQLPVELNKDAKPGASVKLVVRYEGAVYIVPPKAKGDASIESAEPLTQQGAPTKLAIIVNNKGSAHQALQDLSLTVKAASGKTVTLEGDKLEGMLSQNVLAGHRRRFLLPWPADLPVGPVTVTMRIAGSS